MQNNRERERRNAQNGSNNRLLPTNGNTEQIEGRAAGEVYETRYRHPTLYNGERRVKWKEGVYVIEETGCCYQKYQMNDLKSKGYTWEIESKRYDRKEINPYLVEMTTVYYIKNLVKQPTLF